MQRYFLNQDYYQTDNYEVTGEDFHHMVRVMRMTVGQENYLVFLDSTVILAEITAIDLDKQSVWLKEVKKEQDNHELSVQVTIACGYPKGDKSEWIVQKSTELGADEFLFFPAKNSVVKWDAKKREAKTKRFTKISKEAAEQSHRQKVPMVTLLESQKQLVDKFQEYDYVLIAYEESAKTGEKSQLTKVLSSIQSNERLLVLFGPEGGFLKEEIMIFEENGGKCCGLGPRILRAETAPLYLLSAISYQLELA